MVLVQKPEKKKARLCACGNELRGKIADIFSPTIGALIYMTKSRPDIHTAVSFGATHSVTPTRGDFEELIHCLKYLEATQDEGLVLHAGEPNRELILKCYVDASYLTHPDSKSHQGYCLNLETLGLSTLNLQSNSWFQQVRRRVS